MAERANDPTVPDALINIEAHDHQGNDIFIEAYNGDFNMLCVGAYEATKKIVAALELTGLFGDIRSDARMKATFTPATKTAPKKVAPPK